MSILGDLRAEKNKILDEISEYKSGINDINERLDRLYNAKIRVEELKDYASQMRTELNSSVDRWNSWQGSNCGKIKGYIQGDLTDGYNYYISEIGAAQDAISSTITDLENQKNDVWGIIGIVQNTLSNVADEIWENLNRGEDV